MLIGAVLSVWSSILDGCDGEVARIKLQSSDFGCWLETVCDYLYYLFIFGGMSLGLTRTFGNRSYLAWGARAWVWSNHKLSHGWFYEAALRSALIPKNSSRFGKRKRRAGRPILCSTWDVSVSSSSAAASCPMLFLDSRYSTSRDSCSSQPRLDPTWSGSLHSIPPSRSPGNSAHRGPLL